VASAFLWIALFAVFPRSHLTSTCISGLAKSAPLRDIGKVGVPDSILLEPGRLTPEAIAEVCIMG
jgi:response regulator RpfG family c-di-GMP phosphodiesterase